MAMVAHNNMPAINTLNTLNRNTNALAKSLQKVSSGMKINSAADDASGYSISERMRVQIRGLDQANQNSQNALSMMRVASGAVESSVEILRTLKEKALNSANDTNTDLDRATIQREVDQAVDQVDENANVTFNGKRMLDGSTELPITVQEMIVNALSTEWIENCLDLIEDSYGINFRDDKAAVKDISMNFVDDPSSSALAWVTSYPGGAGGKASKLELTVNMHYFSSLDVHDTANVNGEAYDASGVGGVLDRTIAHELTHAIMASAIANVSSFPDLAVMEGMAELVHGIDDMRDLIGKTPESAPYEGGYALFRYMAHQGGDEQQVMKKFMKYLVQEGATALDDAVAYATNGRFADWSDLKSQFTTDAASSDADHLLQYCGIDLANDDTGAITGKDARGSIISKTKDSVVPEGGSTNFWYAPTGKYSTINGLTVEWSTDYEAKTGTLTYQVGTKANQAIKVGFMDMTAEGLGLKAADGTKLSVNPREHAKNAVRLIDQSIQKALNQQATLGALMTRMEFTSANLTVASENTTGAESNIRDADMAKEMTAYTKNNILTQGAQSMLAQANQNLSSVLSLLQ